MVKKKRFRINHWYIIILIIIIILLFKKAGFLGATTSITKTATADFTKKTGTIEMHYGVNEDDNWYDFSKNPSYQEYHKDVGSEYIRVWLSAPSYRPSTFPLQKNGEYKWSNVDNFINAVLNSGAIPFIVFAHGDRCGDREEYRSPFDFSNCEGFGSVPPSSTQGFVDYVDTVMKHFKSQCNSNAYSKVCDINDWYFEIWNEPSGSMWWNGYYYELFNKVYPVIKRVAPSSKVGGPGIRLTENTQADFVVRHLYANTFCNCQEGTDWSCKCKTDSDRMNSAKHYLTWPKDYGYAGKGVEVINGEYNLDWNDMQITNDAITGKWYVAVLINEIKGGTDIELFYSGTSNRDSSGYGMWGANGNKWPVYYDKKNFVKINPTGSNIYKDNYDNNYFDLLAVQNSNGRFITIINKKGSTTTLTLEVIGAGIKKLVDLENNKEYSLSSTELVFSPYEVKYLQAVIEGEDVIEEEIVDEEEEIVNDDTEDYWWEEEEEETTTEETTDEEGDGGVWWEEQEESLGVSYEEPTKEPFDVKKFFDDNKQIILLAVVALIFLIIITRPRHRR